MKLKVALVNPPLSGHKYRGTGVYTEYLFQALRQINDINISLLDYGSNSTEYNIVHYPYFDPFFLTLPFNKAKPTVVTVHDLIPLKYPEKFPKGIKGSIKWQIQRLSLQGANAIITDSKSSEKDIIDLAGIVQNKISVVYLGVNEEFLKDRSPEAVQETKNRLKLPDKFILYVGDINYNKNISGLIKAFNNIHETFPDYKLILIGSGFQNDSLERKELLKLTQTFNIGGSIIMLSNISQKDLANIYKLATLYIQPSFAEGFGLPLLEAMAVNCPIVASNIPTHSEIAADAAFYVNPHDLDDLSKGIIKIITNHKIRNDLIKKGSVRVKLFTWAKCAENTVSIYKSVIINTQ